jgi:hypothetical protein
MEALSDELLVHTFQYPRSSEGRVRLPPTRIEDLPNLVPASDQEFKMVRCLLLQHAHAHAPPTRTRTRARTRTRIPYTHIYLQSGRFICGAPGLGDPSKQVVMGCMGVGKSALVIQLVQVGQDHDSR